MQRDDTRRELKYEVLREVADNLLRGTLTQEAIENIPFKIIPGATARFRC